MGNIMKTYFEVFSMGHPLIDCKQSLELVNQMTAFNHFGQVIENLGKKSITLLFLSIQTFCLQRLGHKDIAYQLYNQCLQLLAQQMLVPPGTTDLDREGNLACALLTLAFYLVGEGGDNRTQAKLFLHNCKFYVSNITKKSNGESELPISYCGGKVSRMCAIHKYMSLIELVLNEDDLNSSIEVVKQFVSYFDRACGQDNVNNSSPFSTLPNAPADPLVNEQETVEYLTKTSSVLEEVMTKKKSCSPKMHDIVKLTFKLMFDGLRLQFLMTDPVKNQDEMEKLADQITELVDVNSEAFASCPTLVVHAVSLAGRVHMRIEDAQSPNIKHKVQRDLNALRLLEKQFNIVALEHGDQMKEMEQWLSQQQDRLPTTSTLNHASLFEDFLASVDSGDIFDAGFMSPHIIDAETARPPSPEDSDRLFEMLLANDVATMD